MTRRRMGRREVTRRALTVPGVAWAAPAALACSERAEDARLHCDDTTGMAQRVIAARRAQHYVDESPDAAERCDNCRYFQAGAEGRCGTCRVLEGPIHPEGTCDLWATTG